MSPNMKMSVSFKKSFIIPRNRNEFKNEMNLKI